MFSNMAAFLRRVRLKHFGNISHPEVVTPLLSQQECCGRVNELYSSHSSGVPLSEPLPNVGVRLANLGNTSVTPVAYDTKITTLENGLKVASEESFGQFSTVGGLICTFLILNNLHKEILIY